MFSEGDKVTITRGKAKGPATIVSSAAERGEYAVKTEDGALVVVKAESIKAPMESTIGEARLADEIQTLVQDLSGYDADGQLQSFVSRLSAGMPGLGARISWPAESNETA